MRWLDQAYLAVRRQRRCFVDGWGDPEIVDMALDGRWSDIIAGPAEIRWTRARAHGDRRIREGEMRSPEPGLPAESRLARVRLIEPRHRPPRGLAVVLASWGDDDWSMRGKVFGPAVEQGVALLMLENPLYGGRRRVGQDATRLRYVSDFVLMGRAIMREGLALLAWARAQGYPRVGVAGFSMGGQMAALTAAISPEPVRIATIAPTATPGTVFLDGPLHRDISWPHLGRDAPERLRAVMESLSVLRLPPLPSGEGVVLVGTRRDFFIAPEDISAIAEHWGVHPRWLDDGHVSVVALRGRAMAQALVDAFA